jgi:hypothetical protein
MMKRGSDSIVDHLIQIVYPEDVISHVQTTGNHREHDMESRNDVPTPHSPNIPPDFVHHNGDVVLH